MYQQGIDNLGLLLSSKYKDNPECMKSMVGKFPSIRAVLCEVYTLRSRTGLCEDITKLDHQNKLELWCEAQKWSGERDRKVLHEVCKSIIAIGSYL